VTGVIAQGQFSEVKGIYAQGGGNTCGASFMMIAFRLRLADLASKLYYQYIVE
jgi:hypothetical protein